MASEPKSPGAPAEAPQTAPDKGIKIFTYPKIIFLFPTMIAALLCALGMRIIGDETRDPTKLPAPAAAEASADAGADRPAPAPANPGTARVRRFTSPQSVLALIFLGVFAFNILVMTIDFPRFTIFALLLGGVALLFFLLWLNAKHPIVPFVADMVEGIYAAANAQFYFLIGSTLLLAFGLIWLTRYLDYWELRPNEILHNHGPFSDLERYPTFNLKFDKEIPDILEYVMFRAGRLVLHVAGERKAIILDNVLFIDTKEEELKKLMSRMEVRVTTDQEITE